MKALFTEKYEIHLGSDLVADGTSEVLTAVEDMSGFDEITYLVKLGDVDTAAVLTFTAKENTASSTSIPTPTAVEITAASAGVITNGALVVTESGGNLDDKIIAITVKGSSVGQRYAFLSITATVESFEIDSIITLKGRAREMAVTQPSDVYAHASAAS